MELKNHKLQEQFAHHKEAVGTTDPALETLFKGICIHVNGLTTPSHQVRTTNLHSSTLSPRPLGAQTDHGPVWWPL